MLYAITQVKPEWRKQSDATYSIEKLLMYSYPSVWSIMSTPISIDLPYWGLQSPILPRYLIELLHPRWTVGELINTNNYTCNCMDHLVSVFQYIRLIRLLLLSQFSMIYTAECMAHTVLTPICPITPARTCLKTSHNKTYSLTICTYELGQLVHYLKEMLKERQRVNPRR